MPPRAEQARVVAALEEHLSHLDVEDVRYAPESAVDREKFTVESGDLLFTR